MNYSKAALFTILLGLLVIGCSKIPEKSACQADNLLLETSSFPGNVWAEIGSRDQDGAPSALGIERAGTSFSTPRDGVAVQDYYQFATVDDAKENYAQLQSDWFNLAPEGTVWMIPNELETIQLRADRFRLGCGQDVIETCRLVALYQTYVVEFKVDMPALTYNDLVYLLQEIDQKMMSCVLN